MYRIRLNKHWTGKYDLKGSKIKWCGYLPSSHHVFTGISSQQLCCSIFNFLTLHNYFGKLKFSKKHRSIVEMLFGTVNSKHRSIQWVALKPLLQLLLLNKVVQLRCHKQIHCILLCSKYSFGELNYIIGYILGVCEHII